MFWSHFGTPTTNSRWKRSQFIMFYYEKPIDKKAIHRFKQQGSSKWFFECQKRIQRPKLPLKMTYGAFWENKIFPDFWDFIRVTPIKISLSYRNTKKSSFFKNLKKAIFTISRRPYIGRRMSKSWICWSREEIRPRSLCLLKK